MQQESMKLINYLMTVSRLGDTVFDTSIPKESITAIVFQDSKDGCLDGQWNVLKNGIEICEVNGTLYIAATGMILAPEDSSYLFAGYKKVRSIDFGNCFDTSAVTSMKFMFDGCEQLERLDVSGFDTSNVQWMNGMFLGCASLQQLDLSSWNTSQVESMNSMFSGCIGLKELNISGFDTAKVTSMGGMFLGCASLQTLDICNFHTSQVTDMGWMFSGCSSLEELDVSGFDTGSVTYMNQMFANCSSLKQLDVRNFQKGENTRAKGMFVGCLAMKPILMKGDTSDTVFGSVIKKDVVEKIVFIDKAEHLPEGAWDVSEHKNGSVMAWERKGVLHICANSVIEAPADSRYLFAGYSNLETVDFGEHVEGGLCLNTSQVTNMSYMFQYCTSLTTLDISEFNTQRLLAMNGMFLGCKALRNLTLCSIRTSIEAKDFVTGCPFTTRMQWMFQKKEKE